MVATKVAWIRNSGSVDFIILSPGLTAAVLLRHRGRFDTYGGSFPGIALLPNDPFLQTLSLAGRTVGISGLLPGR